MIAIKELNWNDEGLLPVVVQNAVTREVLAIAYMDEECLTKSMEKGYPCYRGVAAGEICRREEQRIEMILTAEDLDTLVIAVTGTGCEESDHELPLYLRKQEDIK